MIGGDSVVRGRTLGALAALALAACTLGACSSASGESSSSCTTGTKCAGSSDCGGGARCVGTECVTLYCLKDGETCSTNEVCASKQCQRDTLSSHDAVCVSGGQTVGWTCDDSSGCAPPYFCHRIDCMSYSTGKCSSAGLSGDYCCADSECGSGYKCQQDPTLGCSLQYMHCGSPVPSTYACCNTSDCASGLRCTYYGAQISMSCR